MEDWFRDSLHWINQLTPNLSVTVCCLNSVGAVIPAGLSGTFSMGVHHHCFCLKEVSWPENRQPRSTEQIDFWYAENSKTIPGLCCSVAIAANLIITLLVYAYLTTVPGSDQGEGFYMPGSIIILPPLVFFEIFLLGIPLAILGMIMILFGQRNPLYVVVASIGLVGHLLSLFLGAILFLIMFG